MAIFCQNLLKQFVFCYCLPGFFINPNMKITPQYYNQNKFTQNVSIYVEYSAIAWKMENFDLQEYYSFY